MTAAQRCLIVAALVCAQVGTTSCTSLRPWISRDESQKQAARLQEIQLKVMRYADEYGGGLIEPVEHFVAGAASAQQRLTGQTWQLTQATAAYTIASGPNPMINLLDMVVLAALSRHVVETHWMSAPYGARALPLFEVHRALELQAWSLCADVLPPDQVAHLRSLIAQWRASHPNVREVALVRFKDFAVAAANTPQRAAHPSGGLFSLIGLDPLRNLDPAVREIEQTRQLAERTIYYVQRAPNLLDMQVERLVYQLAAMPEAQSALIDAQRVGLAAGAFGRFADELPLLLQSAELRNLLAEARTTLQAGATALASTQESITALRALMQELRPPGKQRSAVAGKPFDIADYASAAHELGQAAREVRELLAQIDPVAAEALTQRLMDRLFLRSAQLIALLLIAAILFIAARHFFRETRARA